MSRVAKAKILVTRFPFQSRFGGEELHTLKLMEALDKKGHEIQFMGSCPILIKAFEESDFEVENTWLAKPPVTKIWLLLFTFLSPLLFVLAGWKLWKAKRRWDVDTVYMLSFGEKLLMTPWAHFFGLKTLWLEHARIGNWLTKNPWRHVYRFLSSWTEVVVTSRAMVDEIRHHVDTEIHAISCGVIVDKKEALPREILDFLKSGFAVGTVARLTVDKGVDMIAKLVHTKPVMRLVIVGDGPLESRLRELPNQDQILIIPSLPREQLMSLYSKLDLFILGSTQMDPFGMVGAEAMWMGAPVILTDVCGFAAELHHGKEAMIIRPQFAALDKTVKKLMKDESRRNGLSKAGMAYVKSHYKFNEMVKEFEEVLKR